MPHARSSSITAWTKTEERESEEVGHILILLGYMKASAPSLPHWILHITPKLLHAPRLLPKSLESLLTTYAHSPNGGCGCLAVCAVGCTWWLMPGCSLVKASKCLGWGFCADPLCPCLALGVSGQISSIVCTLLVQGGCC